MNARLMKWLMMVALALLLSSCVAFPVGKPGYFVSLGGENAFERTETGAVKYVGSHTESFKDAAGAIETVAMGAIAGSVSKAREVTSQKATSQAQQTARNASNNATKVKLGNQTPTPVPEGTSIVFPPQQ